MTYKYRAMTVTLVQIVTAIQTERPLKWHWGVRHLACILEITVEEVNGFVRLIEKGGTGNIKIGTWRSNPEPFAAKIDLTQNEENLLNLHYTDVKDKFSWLDNDQYVCLGRKRTPKMQPSCGIHKG